ncbi:MAG: hypothetical protein AAF726_10300 [Planctomycetota bacterium]
MIRLLALMTICVHVAQCAASPESISADASDAEKTSVEQDSLELASTGFHLLLPRSPEDEDLDGEVVGKERLLVGALHGGRLVPRDQDHAVVATLDERAVPTLSTLAARSASEPQWLVFVVSAAEHSRFEVQSLLDRLTAAPGTSIEIELATGLDAFEAGQILASLQP